MKNLIMKTTKDGNLHSDDFQDGLLEWRNTPGKHGLSPAQIVYGQPMRTALPIHKSAFLKKWQVKEEEYREKKRKNMKKQKEHHDRTAKPMKRLCEGDQVRVQDPVDKTWSRTAVIIKKGRFRKYLIEMSGGRTIWRNRKHLRLTQPF